MNGMAFLERASVNIKEFLSPGGPGSLELGSFLKSIRSGLSIKLGPTTICVCVWGGGYLLKCFLFPCQALTEIKK